MATTAITFSNDFSWARVGRVASYYYPVLRLQMIIYPAVSLVCYLLGLWISQTSLTGVIGAMFSSLLSIMAIFAPAVLARRNCQVCDSMLPALVSEKLAVLLGYFLVVVPALTYGVYYGVGYCIESLAGIDNGPLMSMDMLLDASWSHLLPERSHLLLTVLPNTLEFTALSGLCLWMVLMLKRNRTLGSILATAGAWVGLSMITSVIIMITAFSIGFNAGRNAEPMAQADPDAVAEQVMTQLAPSIEIAIVVTLVACLILTVVALWGIYRQVARKQL